MSAFVLLSVFRFTFLQNSNHCHTLKLMLQFTLMFCIFISVSDTVILLQFLLMSPHIFCTELNL